VRTPSTWIQLATAGLAVVLIGCSGTSQGASLHSLSTVSTSHSASAASSPSASPVQTDPRLVVADYAKAEVRLARLNAQDKGSAKGQFQEIVGGQVIVLNGTSLVALSHSGVVKTLGQLSGSPESVVVKPDLSQWLYMTLGGDQVYHLQLGSPGHDVALTANPALTQEQVFRPYGWNSTGIYVTKEPLGLGGAGPFLEYHFPLAKLDPTSGQVTEISPACIAYAVLDDGTLVCGNHDAGTIEVRRTSGASNTIHMGTDVNGFIRVAASLDSQRVIAGRNGSNSPVINYQMVVADLTSPSVAVFGLVDYLPDAWLPDGRVIATHQCVISEWGGGPCSGSLDGTYFFSADGSSRTLFFKLASGTRIVGVI
jgi:hypothetical protein